jgi:hypothetical protein
MADLDPDGNNLFSKIPLDTSGKGLALSAWDLCLLKVLIKPFERGWNKLAEHLRLQKKRGRNDRWLLLSRPSIQSPGARSLPTSEGSLGTKRQDRLWPGAQTPSFVCEMPLTTTLPIRVICGYVWTAPAGLISSTQTAHRIISGDRARICFKICQGARLKISEDHRLPVQHRQGLHEGLWSGGYCHTGIVSNWSSCLFVSFKRFW